MSPVQRTSHFLGAVTLPRLYLMCRVSRLSQSPSDKEHEKNSHLWAVNKRELTFRAITSQCIFCFSSHPVVIIKTSKLQVLATLSEVTEPLGRCENANRFNMIHLLLTVYISSSCSAIFSSLLHKCMKIYYFGGKHTTVHNDCS